MTRRGVANFSRTGFLGRIFGVRLVRAGLANLQTFNQIRVVRLWTIWPDLDTCMSRFGEFFLGVSRTFLEPDF